MTQNNTPPAVVAAIPTQTITPTSKQALSTSIEALDSNLAQYLRQLSLPVEAVLAPIDERRAIIDQFESAIAVLPYDQRPTAAYLSKYCISISIGLFDAALNFIWDETVLALRRHADNFDLHYFFDIAEKRDDARKQLKSVEDFGRIDDFVLIDTCARVGLITEVDRERLRHVNYMRNHASAAHPTNASVNGLEMVSWLSNCLRYAIAAKPDAVAVQIKRLIDNVRTQPIAPADITNVTSALANLPQATVDDLLHSLFGLFTDAKTGSPARENILALAPAIWTLSSEARRYAVGARVGNFSRHGESGRVAHATIFLQAADGLKYRDENILVAELLEKLQSLRSAHFGHNNFYNEWPHAANLAASIPQSGIIPDAVLYEFVKVVSQCAIGNGYGYSDGVDSRALPHFNEFIGHWTDREIKQFIRCFDDSEFTVDLPREKPDIRARKLLSFFRSKTSNILIQRAIDVLLAQPTKLLHKANNTKGYRDALAALPR